MFLVYRKYCTLAQVQYTAKAMQEHVDKWESMCSHSAPIDVPIDEIPVVLIFVESLGDVTNSSLGTALSVLLARDNHTRRQVHSQLLQEFDSQPDLSLVRKASHKNKLAALQNKNNARPESTTAGTVQISFIVVGQAI